MSTEDRKSSNPFSTDGGTGGKTGAVPYSEFVDWDKRLATEGPFFKSLFQRESVRSVIDVGAGSARHPIMFASWGLQVDGVDPSESMLAEARENLATFATDIQIGGGSVKLHEGGFGGLAALHLGLADALTCTGNSLPHVDGLSGLREAFADFSAVLAPGGIVVLHLLNHARLLEKQPRVVPPKVRETPSGTRVFLRLIDYPAGAEYLDFDFVTLTRDFDGAWSLESRRSPHTALPVSVIETELLGAGFGDLEFLGDHSGRPLEVLSDESVIVIARKK